MASITQAEHVAWQSGTQKNLRLEFSDGTILTNSSIVSESMTLEQTIADQSSLFGNVYASSFKVQVFDSGDRYAGLTVNVSMSVEYDGETYTRNIGEFYVLSDKLTADGISRNLECYDMLYVVLTNNYTSWYESLTFPMTLKSFRDSFFNEIGITQKSVTLQNDSMSISKKNVSTLSGSAIIGNILSLNTVWGYIDNDGNFDYVSPKNTVDYTIADNSYVQGSFAFEEYETSAYSSVTISQTITETIEDESGSYEQEVEQSVTVGDNSGSAIFFQNNLFTYGKTDTELTTIANNILSRIDDLSFTPSVVSFPPYMGLELGDVFSITTSKKVVRFPVLDRRLSGITALRDTFTAEGVEYASENANSTESQLSYALSSTNVIAGMAKTAQQLAGEAQASADDAKEAAETAWNWADDAHDAAETAWNHADDAANAASAAQTSAGQAQASAIQANASANNALTQLSTIEDVFNVLNWIADHGTYALTTDTSVVPGKYYFTRSGTSPNYSYTVVTNPIGNPQTNGYYELTGVDEAVTNYISSHLALTDQGLWVIKDNQGYKVLLANDGLKIYDNQGHLVSTFGESIVFDSSRPQTIGNNSTYIKWYDSNNDQIPDSIEISGSNVSIADSVTIGGMPTKVSDLTNDSGYQTSGQVSSAISSATSGLATKGNAIKATVSVYYRKTTSGAPSKPTASTTIGTSASTDNAWEYVMPQPKKGCYFYTCERYTFADDNVAFSAVRSIDNATYTSKWCNETDNTYIDGGAIYANSVTSDKISVSDLRAIVAKIGNWDITERRIESDHVGDGGYRVGMQNTASKSDTAAAFYAGTNTAAGGGIASESNSNFYVRQDGYLYCSNAKIKGNVTMNSGTIADSVTIGGNTANTLATQTDVANLDTGLGIKWNASTFAGTWNAGEAYFCKYDSSTGAYTNADGWVMFNGVKRTVPKGMQINPNTVIPYNTRTYMVLRLSSASATTGTMYYVWYASSWKSVTPATPSADNIADWTWAVATDIVLCSYVEPGSEAALVEYEQYTPVRTAQQITTGNTAYQQAATAQTTANNAAKTATNYITADTSGIKVHASGTSGTDYVGITSNSLKMYSGGNELVTMNSTGALVLGLAAGNHVQLTGTGMHLAGINSAGTATVNRMTLSSSGITMRNDSGTVTATIGDTITLGTVAANKFNTYIDSSSFKIRNNTTAIMNILAENKTRATIYLAKLASGNRTVNFKPNGFVTAASSIVAKCTYLQQATVSGETVWQEKTANVTLTLGTSTKIGSLNSTLLASLSNNTLSIKMTIASADKSATNPIKWIMGTATAVLTLNNSYISRMELGVYPDSSSYPLFAVGNGTSSSATSNAFSVLFTGDVKIGDQILSDEDGLCINGRTYAKNEVLWTGGYYMSSTQTADLNGLITDQPNGVVLAWSAYASGAAQNYDWLYYFVPKWHISTSGTHGVTIPICKASTNGNGTTWGAKYVYIHDSYIDGYAGNNAGNAANFVLRAVIGV